MFLQEAQIVLRLAVAAVAAEVSEAEVEAAAAPEEVPAMDVPKSSHWWIAPS